MTVDMKTNRIFSIAGVWTGYKFSIVVVQK